MTIVSIMGIAISSMAMCIVFSAFSGLKEFNLSLQKDITSDIKITPKKGKYFSLSLKQIEQLNNIKNVKHISKSIQEKAFFSFKEKEIVAYIKGIDKKYHKVIPIHNHIYKGKLITQGKYASIGSEIAIKLGVSTNDIYNYLKIYIPNKNSNSFNDINSFKTIHTKVSGLFHSNNMNFDSKYVLIPLELSRDILEYEKNTYSCVEIKLHNPNEIEDTNLKIKELLGRSLNIQTKREQNSFIYKMINMEALVTYLIFVLILIISIFTLAGVLSILMIDKKIHLKTLHSIGLPLKKIENIFIFQGIFITLIGCFLGVCIGLGICLAQKQYGLITLNGSSLAYPVKFEFTNLASIIGTVCILGYITSLVTIRFNHNKL